MFNPQAMTAASRTLKFGTMLTVCRGNTCIKIRVNDRGPYIKGRDLDLSQAAAEALGYKEAGLAKLQIVEMVPPASRPHRGFRVGGR
ncbi:MAG TPA: septal ring lytic transglycosylase RlpA family protein [Candidatus Angelobacter sp.]|nr:septal ring lytic transglycosylase RlpA family protein [Candidatus Angelobacter sp.]